MKFGLLGEFETILPNEEKLAPEVYLKGIDRNFLLKTGAWLLGFEPATTPWLEWRFFVENWFRTENSDFAQKVYNKCLELERKSGESVSLYYNIAALRFFEFAFSLPETNVTQSHVETEINVFKAYLVFLSRTLANQTRSTNFIANNTEHNQVILQLVNIMFPTSDIENYIVEEVTVCQFVKAILLFEFLESNASCPSLLKAFYEYFGITHWREYLECILPIVKAHIDRTKNGLLELRAENDENYEKSKRFLQLLSLNGFDEDNKPDFIHLRANPIFQITEDRYVIISPLFVAEKIYKSLYFHLNDLNGRLPEKNAIVNFRSFYGGEFAENYMLYQVLEYIYGQRRYIRFTGKQLEKFDGGLPDYYIRNGNHIFLFENKDTFVPGNIKQSGDMEAILNDLRSKLYYNEQKSGKISPKAVKQISENVRRVLAHENEFDKDYKINNVNIYPILVLNDSSFNTPGLNRIVNDWFRAELDVLNLKGYKVDRVRPITIINIDTLILYGEFLRLKKISLNDLLIAFHRTMRFPKNKQVGSAKEAREYFGGKNLSFAKFIDDYTNIGYKQLGKGLIGVAMKKYIRREMKIRIVI